MINTHKSFKFHDFEITVREIIFSILIISIMSIIGVFIAGKISNYELDKDERYNKAAKIESQELFEYGMRTNIGDAFVYGKLEAVDSVSYEEINGDYMYVKKVKEKYTQHTRQVAHTRTVNGKSETYYTTEIYYTWDYAGSEDKKCKLITFLNVTFASYKIKIPDADYITTIKESNKIRYKYYGTGTSYTGTIFTDLRNKDISDESPFYEMNIEDTIHFLCIDGWTIVFCIIWAIITIEIVFGFYYFDNEWLE